MAWVPSIPDVEKWTRHFKLMAEGKLPPPRNGYYEVRDLPKKEEKPEKHKKTKVIVNYVTPTAGALARAKSELKLEKLQKQYDMNGGGKNPKKTKYL